MNFKAVLRCGFTRSLKTGKDVPAARGLGGTSICSLEKDKRKWLFPLRAMLVGTMKPPSTWATASWLSRTPRGGGQDPQKGGGEADLLGATLFSHHCWGGERILLPSLGSFYDDLFFVVVAVLMFSDITARNTSLLHPPNDLSSITVNSNRHLERVRGVLYFLLSVLCSHSITLPQQLCLQLPQLLPKGTCKWTQRGPRGARCVRTLVLWAGTGRGVDPSVEAKLQPNLGYGAAAAAAMRAERPTIFHPYPPSCPARREGEQIVR